MSLNDDLVGLVISYLDITEYEPSDRTDLLSAIQPSCHKKILNVWKSATCFKVINSPNVELTITNGKRHCEDGPAMISIRDGSKLWFWNEMLHRSDGPAAVFPARKMWYWYGKLHRTDGPAVEWIDDRKEWWENGVRLA